MVKIWTPIDFRPYHTVGGGGGKISCVHSRAYSFEQIALIFDMCINHGKHGTTTEEGTARHVNTSHSAVPDVLVLQQREESGNCLVTFVACILNAILRVFRQGSSGYSLRLPVVC